MVLWRVPTDGSTCCAQDVHIAAVDQQQYKACGVCALYECAGIRGSQVPFEVVYDLVHPKQDGTSTLAEIAVAAEKIGFVPVATNLKYETLVELPRPSILHVREVAGQPEGNHFIVYLGSTSKREPVCLDAPSSPQILTRSSFKARWTGNALVLFDSAEAAAEFRNRLDRSIWREEKPWIGSALALVFLAFVLVTGDLAPRG